jgi:RimJ/RimL family protein N-acetyltransferase
LVNLSGSMDRLETARLVLRRLTLDDAAFILQLVNEPSWLQFIGDKGVRDLEGARDYLRKGAFDLYGRFGFGPLCVELKDSPATPIGICGLIKRPTLEDVDIGYALLPGYWGRGYAHEAASAVLAEGRREFGLKRIVALTALENPRSVRLLERLGMKFVGRKRITPDAPDSKLFVAEE